VTVPLRILVVDAAASHATVVREFIRSGGLWPDAEVHAVRTYDEAVAALAQGGFDLAFLSQADMPATEGQLAHDVNNQLTAILGYCNLMLEDASNHALRRDLEEIRAAGERAAALTGLLLAFSRRGTPGP